MDIDLENHPSSIFSIPPHNEQGITMTLIRAFVHMIKLDGR